MLTRKTQLGQFCEAYIIECLPAWILSPLGDRGNAVRF